MNQSNFRSAAFAIAAIALWVAGCSGGGGSSSVVPTLRHFVSGSPTPGPGGSPTPSPSPSGHPSPTPKPSPTPTPSSTPGPIAQTHVITWQDDSGVTNPSYTWSQMAPYVNWTVVQPASSLPAQSAGIKTVLYTDPNRVYQGSPEYSNDESEFAHDCSNNRITILNTIQLTYLTDPTSSVLLSLWQQHVALYNQIAGAPYNLVFEDTPLVANVSALPCGYVQSAWIAAQNTMNVALNYPILVNGLGNLANGPDQPSPAMGLLNSTVGGMMEGCYSNADGPDPMPRLQVWHTFENTEIQVLASGKTFLCRGFDAAPDTTSQPERIYMYASFLLTYDPAHAIISPKFTPANNGFFIQPENQLVALDPVVMQPASIDQLNVGPNVYGRQYKNCYYAGNWIGACASIVNSDSGGQAHPMPWTNIYHHTLVLSGGDILDGGTASTNGPPPPSSIPGTSAIIVIQ